MKVEEIMSGNPSVCDLNESLAEAAKKMWDADCGVLPVLKDGQEVVGLITDRDICMAIAMRDCNPASVSAEEVITGEVYSVTPEDEIQNALQVMREHRVRRLPVISADGELKGMLSLNDLISKAEKESSRKTPPIAYGDVINTFKAICAHPVPMKKDAVAGL